MLALKLFELVGPESFRLYSSALPALQLQMYLCINLDLQVLRLYYNSSCCIYCTKCNRITRSQCQTDMMKCRITNYVIRGLIDHSNSSLSFNWWNFLEQLSNKQKNICLFRGAFGTKSEEMGEATLFLVSSQLPCRCNKENNSHWN